MGRKAIYLTSTIPVEPATKPALLSWDQLLVFDIELDNQKLRLFLFFFLNRAR